MRRVRGVAACLIVSIAAVAVGGTVARIGRADEPATASAATGEITLLPANIQLTTTESRQRLLVQLRRGEQLLGPAPASVRWTSSDEQVAKVVEQTVVPVGNGNATITARLGPATATAAVVVSGQKKTFTWSFRNHVESVLSKSGCNGGACHGARAGQKGFRLTLFGFDLEADHAYLTRQARGRRVVLADPGRSLILTKPTGAIPHKGGVRFDVDSLEYRVLVEWIAAGAPGPADDDPVIERLEVLPKYSIQAAGSEQQMLVMAHFSDGHVEDVTPWAKYTSVERSVATVDDHGKARIVGPGEGAVKVWYLNYNQLAFLSVPYSQDVPAQAFTALEPVNFIDRHVVQKLQSLNIPPAPRADDATFLRRAFLDTLGILPTAEEVRRFLQDDRPDKRQRLVDELLGRPEFVDYWTYQWSDLLLVSGDRLRPKPLKAYYGWIRRQVAANRPWDEMVRELITASGSTVENGAANFYALHQTPEEMAETMAQAFMGLSINCARCHNHPLEKWTNDQYYGLANMFARVRAKGWGGDFRSNAFDGERVVFADSRGELIQPSSGRPQPPRPLDAPPLAFDDPVDRRIVLARWLTAAENPYFSRAIVNRVWANFFAVGLKEKVDDMRVTNPASNEELLTAAAEYLVENDFDLRRFIRAILNSQTYQRASAASPQNRADQRFYARYYPRRLKAEVLLDAISQVTGVPTEFKGHPKGTRALQLPDSAVQSYFLATFGRPKRLITCDCERSNEPSMTQVLHLYNGNTLNDKLRKKGNRIDQWIAAKTTDAEVVDELYLAALARSPQAAERQRLLEQMAEAKGGDRRQLLEDLVWSVLSSREFLFGK